jgi:gliding motility-associated-like protein
MKAFTLFFFLFFIALSFSIECFSQKRYNVWAFGNEGGINFNTSPPTGFKSKSPEKDPPYYLSSICDNDGNLMFYTDGLTVWNRDGFKMPVYNNWWPLTGDVMPLVCPRPGSDTLFYLFAISTGANPYQLQALPLRLKAAGDLDEMIYPRPTAPNNFQVKLQKNCSMALAGTAHCNQVDYWVSVYSGHALYSYLVTAAGINSTPVITNVSETTILDSTINTGFSNIKFSANSEKAIVPDFDENRVIVYDFDNANGRFSNPLVIELPKAVEEKLGFTLEEIELSPDATKLYLATKFYELIDDGTAGVTQHEVAQCNLKAGSVAEIIKSYTTVSPISDRDFCTRAACFFTYRTLNIGPDGKIYVGMRFADKKSIKVDEAFSVIEAPNEAGLNCRYRKLQFSVGTKYKFGGYNYLRSSSYTLKENGITVQKENCADKPVKFSLLMTKLDSVKWNFGDVASGTANSSTSLYPQHQYPGPGIYTVKALIYSRCIVDTATTIVTIKADVAVKVPAEIRDTSMCFGDALVLNARSGTSNAYTWENGLIYADRTITEAGKYRVVILNDCSVATKEFSVTYDKCPCAMYVPTAFTPNGDGLNDVFKPSTQCYAKQYKFNVFNRFGQIVFSSSDPEKGWNGFVGPYMQATGTFIWTLQYQDPNSKKILQEKGTVLLIR